MEIFLLLYVASKPPSRFPQRHGSSLPTTEMLVKVSAWEIFELPPRTIPGTKRAEKIEVRNFFLQYSQLINGKSCIDLRMQTY